MATEQVVSFFNNSGAPVTGLTPTILGLGTDGTTLFSGNMDEVGSGRYIYTILGYNKGRTYLITVDGGNTLPDGIRYQNTINLLDAYPNKLDWRGTFTFIQDNEALAKAVWNFQISELDKRSYGSLFVGGDNYDKVLKSFEDVHKRIAEIKMPDFNMPEIPKGVSAAEIEALLLKHKPVKDEAMFEAIQGAVNLINHANDNILSIIDKVDSLSNDDINEKLEEGLGAIDTQGVIDGIKEMKEFLEKYDDMLENMDIIPTILDQYTEIVKSLGSTKDLDEKVGYMTLVMKDILANVKSRGH